MKMLLYLNIWKQHTDQVKKGVELGLIPEDQLEELMVNVESLARAIHTELNPPPELGGPSETQVG